MADVKIVSGRQEEDPSAVLKTLLFFTLLMVTLPISLYFFTKAYVFEGFFLMSSTNSYFYAAIVAITVVHCVLAMFIYYAWMEGSKPTKKE